MLGLMFAIVSKYVWLISILMLAIVTIASLLPLPVLPEVPGSDKAHHLISYFLIALPVSLVKPKYWLPFLLTVFVWSGVIELIQPLVNRYGEWLDLLVNSLGVLIGVVLGGLGNSSFKRL